MSECVIGPAILVDVIRDADANLRGLPVRSEPSTPGYHIPSGDTPGGVGGGWVRWTRLCMDLNGVRIYRLPNSEPERAALAGLLSGAAASLIESPTSSDVVPINVVDHGAIGDGRNDTASLQAALDAVTDVNRIVAFHHGTFMVDVANPLRPKSGTVLALGDATIKAIPTELGAYSVLRMEDVEGVSVIGGTIAGDLEDHLGATGEWGNCISVVGSSVNLESVCLEQAWGDGVYVTTGTAQPASVILHGCEIRNCRRNGLSVVDCADLLVCGCWIHDIGGTSPECGIDLEPNEATQRVNAAVIRDSVIEGCAGRGILSVGVQADSMGDLSFQRLTVDGAATCIEAWYGSILIDECVLRNGGFGVLLKTGADQVVSGCTVEDSTSRGVSCEHTQRSTISGCTVLRSGVHGVELRYTEDARVEECRIHDYGNLAIRQYETTGTTLSNNETD